MTPRPALVVVSRAADAGIDSSAVLKTLIGRFGGRGGGKPDAAQGGGLEGDPAEIRDAASGVVTSSVTI